MLGFMKSRRVRLAILLSLLALMTAAAVAHHVRVAYYERQLERLAQDLIAEINRNDPLPLPEEGPEADVEIRTYCAFSNLVFGEKTGKVVLEVKPRPHARDQHPQQVVYFFAHEKGSWRQTDSCLDCVAYDR